MAVPFLKLTSLCDPAFVHLPFVCEKVSSLSFERCLAFVVFGLQYWCGNLFFFLVIIQIFYFSNGYKYLFLTFKNMFMFWFRYITRS